MNPLQVPTEPPDAVRPPPCPGCPDAPPPKSALPPPPPPMAVKSPPTEKTNEHPPPGCPAAWFVVPLPPAPPTHVAPPPFRPPTPWGAVPAAPASTNEPLPVLLLWSDEDPPTAAVPNTRPPRAPPLPATPYARYCIETAWAGIRMPLTSPLVTGV